VQAYDGGSPSRISTNFASVSLSVLRNDNDPTFTNLPNRIKVKKDIQPGPVGFTVSANDKDTRVGF
jgi:hypothetical protein